MTKFKKAPNPTVVHYPESEKEQQHTIQRYYRLQSQIYDLTRWSFLFGRLSVLRRLPLYPRQGSWQIHEIGCGTGFNLRRLAARFPHARITGWDVSEDMLNIARRQTRSFSSRVELIHQPYTFGNPHLAGQLDAILFSYSLTMINPQWEELLLQARNDLKPGGLIAVVDFHDSRYPWFKKHMANHHVRMDSHLLPFLTRHFNTEWQTVRTAYGGIWHYACFIGRKKK